MDYTLSRSHSLPEGPLLASVRDSARFCVRWSLLIGALGLDAWSLRLLQETPPTAVAPYGFLLLHAAASLLFAAHPACQRRWPKLPGRRAGKMAAGFVAAFFLPGLGIAGWLAICPLVGTGSRKAAVSRWRHTAPRALSEVPETDEPRRMGRTNVAGILQFSPDPRQRIQALKSLDGLADRDAIPLLRLALQDPEDDVRLLGFAMLDRKQKRMDEKIARGHCLERLEAGGAKADRLLALHYWEQAYSGLAQADFVKFLLDRAHDHARNALSANSGEAGLHFLLGRILLHRKAAAEAREALLRAGERGIHAAKLLPYLHEIALADRPGHDGFGSAGSGPAPSLRRAGSARRNCQ